MATDERAFHDQRLQRPERVVAFAVLPAPPRRDVGDAQFFTEEMPRERGQKGEERRGLDRAGAERIGDRDVARARRFHESGHAEEGIAAQFQRIAAGVVHAADDHVHRLQALERFQENPPVAHREIAALHQLVAEITREVGVLEIGFGVRARA